MHTIGNGWLWTIFFVFVIAVLFIDMFVLGGRKSHIVSVHEALRWVIIWVMCALIFNIGLWFYLANVSGTQIATEKALQFFTGYLIEESLSVDNMFVFILIFSFLSIPKEYQRRILLFGVLGAIVFRLLMIVSGTWLFSRFHWLLYLFGFFLIITGIKMFFAAEKKQDLEKSALVIFLKNHLRFTRKIEGDRFFIIENAKIYATPLLMALILIEVADLIFALDSIPAIFAITLDPFIIVTSNIFAILGLRALYFLLCHMADRFYLLKYGIALVLVFVGIKMLIAPAFDIPILASLGIVVAILTTTVILSLMSKFKKGDINHG